MPNKRPQLQTNEQIIDFPVEEYIDVYPCWEMIWDLWGGTKAMRDAGTRYLPMEPAETAEAYGIRLDRSVLKNVLKDSIRRMVAKPFSREVSFREEVSLPEKLEPIQHNADRAGRDLTQFAKDVFTSGIKFGLAHVLVDFPIMPEGATKRDEAEVGARPLFKIIEAPDMIGWKSVNTSGGETKLTEIRYYDYIQMDKGPHSSETTLHVRVMREEDWELWQMDSEKEQNDPKAWTMIESGRHTFGAIPLTTFYTARTGFMTAEPALMDLAEANLQHWQKYSDYNSGVRACTHSLLFMKGLTRAEMKKRVTIGPAQTYRTGNENAECMYVEHTGTGLQAARQDLVDLEEYMEGLGMQPLVSRSGDKTATGRVIDEARSFTDIQSWVRAAEMTVDEAYNIGGQWVGVEVPEEFGTDINNDFGVSMSDSSDLSTLDNARTRADIDQRTYLEELKRRGVLHEQTDVEEVSARTKTEGPPLSTLFMDDEDPDDDKNGDGNAE